MSTSTKDQERRADPNARECPDCGAILLYTDECQTCGNLPIVYVHVGSGIVTTHASPNSYTQGYYSAAAPMLEGKRVHPACIVIDTHPMGDHDLVSFAISGPMCDPWLPEWTCQGWNGRYEFGPGDGTRDARLGNSHSLGYVSMDVYCEIARKFGGRITDVAGAELDADQAERRCESIRATNGYRPRKVET